MTTAALGTHHESGEGETRLCDEDAAFLVARAATGRAAKEPEKNPLLDPNLYTIALRAVSEARGPLVDGTEPFLSTLWLGGAWDTLDGRKFLGSFLDFVTLLKERATKLAPKRQGWVVEPTTNTDGQRTNASTIAMHALFLDCDNNGSWDELLAVLEQTRLAHIAYQSGGYTPEAPKWRVVLPLSQPFDTSDETKREAWKAVYNHSRVVFGALGQLRGVGLDPTTDTPCSPWFLTEKRHAGDPDRQVLFCPGHSLDLMALALALPPVEASTTVARTDRSKIVTVAQGDLDNDRREEIVSALATATNSMPSGRHGVYLALPGVLLDRGLSPDDVLLIIEEVSLRYPRSHPTLHADNLHGARTTIRKWEHNDRVTRIGTLNEIAPQLARAVDEVLPDPDRVGFVELARRLARRDSSANPPPPQDGEEDAPAWAAPVDLKMLRSFAVKMRRKKSKSESAKDAVHWILLDRLLKKKTLANPLERDAETQLGREDALYRLVGLLAFRFPKNTPVEVVVELLRPSIYMTLETGEPADKWLKMASRWYVMSLAARLEMDAKKEAERKSDLEFSQTYYARGRVLS